MISGNRKTPYVVNNSITVHNLDLFNYPLLKKSNFLSFQIEECHYKKLLLIENFIIFHLFAGEGITLRTIPIIIVDVSMNYLTRQLLCCLS